MQEYRYTFEIGELGVRVYQTIRMLIDVSLNDLLAGLNNGVFVTTTYHNENGPPCVYETNSETPVAQIIDQAIEVDEAYIHFEPEDCE